MITRKNFVVLLTGYFILIVIWSIVLNFIPNKDSAWNFGFNLAYGLFYFFAGGLALLNVKSIGMSNNLGKAFLYLGLGLVSFAGALLVWWLYNSVFRIDVPYPSLADVFFVIFYPLSLLGFLYFIRAGSETMETVLLVKSFLVLMVMSVLVLSFNRLFIIDVNQSNISQLFNLLYPVGDIFIASIAFIGLSLAKGRMKQGLLLLLFGALVGVVADLVFSYRTSIDVYWNGDISDLFYAFSGFLFALGMVNSVSSVFNNPIDPHLNKESFSV